MKEKTRDSPSELASREREKQKRQKMSSASKVDEENCRQARNIGTLHALLGDLAQEMKSFDYQLPLHEIDDRVKEGEDPAILKDVLSKKKDAISMKLAEWYDQVYQIHQKVSSDIQRGLTTEILDGALYTLQGYISRTVTLQGKYSAHLISIVNQNPEWVSADSYSLIYDSLEADFPFMHEKVGLWLSASGLLAVLEKGEKTSQLQFHEHEKAALQKGFAMISRVEDLLVSIMNIAIKIDEDIEAVVAKYVQPAGSKGKERSEAELQFVQDIHKMLKDMTEIEDSLLGGLTLNQSFSKGQILGLVAFYCRCQIGLWLNRELYEKSYVLSAYEGKLEPVLSPLQSAGCMMYFLQTCNNVRRQELLHQTNAFGEKEEQPNINRGGLKA